MPVFDLDDETTIRITKYIYEYTQKPINKWIYVLNKKSFLESLRKNIQTSMLLSVCASFRL